MLATRFPASADDVRLWAAIGTKFIRRAVIERGRLCEHFVQDDYGDRTPWPEAGVRNLLRATAYGCPAQRLTILATAAQGVR